jgi:hypothetical protein
MGKTYKTRFKGSWILFITLTLLFLPAGLFYYVISMEAVEED